MDADQFRIAADEAAVALADPELHCGLHLLGLCMLYMAQSPMRHVEYEIPEVLFLAACSWKPSWLAIWNWCLDHL